MTEKIKCDCGITFIPEEGQTHCSYCGIKISDIDKKSPLICQLKEKRACFLEKQRSRRLKKSLRNMV